MLENIEAIILALLLVGNAIYIIVAINNELKARKEKARLRAKLGKKCETIHI